MFLSWRTAGVWLQKPPNYELSVTVNGLKTVFASLSSGPPTPCGWGKAGSRSYSAAEAAEAGRLPQVEWQDQSQPEIQSLLCSVHSSTPHVTPCVLSVSWLCWQWSVVVPLPTVYRPSPQGLCLTTNRHGISCSRLGHECGNVGHSSFANKGIGLFCGYYA